MTKYLGILTQEVLKVNPAVALKALSALMVNHFQLGFQGAYLM